MKGQCQEEMTFKVSPNFMIPVLYSSTHKMVSAYDMTSAILSFWYKIWAAMVPLPVYSLMRNKEKLSATKEQLSLLGTIVGIRTNSTERIFNNNCKRLGRSLCQALTTFIYRFIH